MTSVCVDIHQATEAVGRGRLCCLCHGKHRCFGNPTNSDDVDGDGDDDVPTLISFPETNPAHRHIRGSVASVGFIFAHTLKDRQQ